MLRISLSEEAREAKESFTQLDMADYAKKSFGMYGGKEEKVKLLGHNFFLTLQRTMCHKRVCVIELQV